MGSLFQLRLKSKPFLCYLYCARRPYSTEKQIISETNHCSQSIVLLATTIPQLTIVFSASLRFLVEHVADWRHHFDVTVLPRGTCCRLTTPRRRHCASSWNMLPTDDTTSTSLPVFASSWNMLPPDYTTSTSLPVFASSWNMLPPDDTTSTSLRFLVEHVAAWRHYVDVTARLLMTVETLLFKLSLKYV